MPLSLGLGLSLVDRYGGGPATDPHFANVSLLLHFDGVDGSTTFTDNSSYAHTITAIGNAQIDTAQSKFGGASGLFDGTGDAVRAADVSGEFDFGTGDFTVETWVRFNATTQQVICASDNNAEFFFQCFLGGTTIGIGRNGSAIDSDATITGLITTGVWYHVAVTRAAGTVRFFLNGSELVINSGGTNNQNYAVTSNMVIGSDAGGTVDLNGRSDDFRITKGVARYTAPFTPPSSAFPDQ